MKRLWICCTAVFALTLSTIAENWPGFRGPTRQGHSSERNLPLHWSAESNVVWKAAIPGEGWSSPIVWEDRVFVTAALDRGTECHVIAIDRKSGKIVWDTTVFTQVTRRKESKNSWATPTPTTDGKVVYAVFGGGGVAAVDFDGKLLWKNTEVEFYSRHGLGASPILHDGLLIMPYDGSSSRFEAADKVTDAERIGWQIPWDKSFIAALDTKTGQRVWTGKRGMSRIAHVSPLILEIDGGKQLVSGAGDRMQGFNLKTGDLIWSLYAQGEGVTPSPVAGEGMLFTSSGFEKTTLRGIKLANIKGDVTETHIAWEQKKGCPTLPSPIYVKPRLYSITDGGIVTCYNPQSGDVLWQERVGGNFSASPVYTDGRIYAATPPPKSPIDATRCIYFISVASTKIHNYFSSRNLPKIDETPAPRFIYSSKPARFIYSQTPPSICHPSHKSHQKSPEFCPVDRAAKIGEYRQRTQGQILIPSL